MTDKQRLQYILDNTQTDNIESVFKNFLFTYADELSIITLNNLRAEIQKVLDDKIEEIAKIKYIANERATWIKMYLEGRMWLDEETAKKNVQPQIDNCQVIIDACNSRGDW